MVTMADIPLEKVEKMKPFLWNIANRLALCLGHPLSGTGMFPGY